MKFSLALVGVVLVLCLCTINAEDTSGKKDDLNRKFKTSRTSKAGLFSSAMKGFMNGFSNLKSEFGDVRAFGGGGGGGGYGGDGYDDDGGDSGLSTIIGMLALLLAGLALLAALIGPLLGMGLLNNNNNILPTVNGGTLSVLPTNPAVVGVGRRKREAGMGFERMDMVDIMSLLDDSIDRFDTMTKACQKESMCNIISDKEDKSDMSNATKNFVVLFRALKSMDVSLLSSNPQEYIRNLMEKVTSVQTKCSDQSPSKCK